LYIGTFEMGIAFVAWLRALRLSRTTAQVGQLIYLTPFLSLLAIGLVVGEPIYASTVAGLALIVGGIVLQRRSG
jgi:drug/metabolite transporter (DMT)-like permease